MNCTFYKTISPNEKITKELTDSIQTTCEIIDMTNILTPKIIVNSEYINYNYIYLSDLNRYYFITDIVISNNYIILSLSIDVLYTYRSNILNSEFFVERSTNFHPTDIPDNIITSNRVIQASISISDDIITNNLNFLLGVR